MTALVSFALTKVLARHGTWPVSIWHCEAKHQASGHTDSSLTWHQAAAISQYSPEDLVA